MTYAAPADSRFAKAMQKPSLVDSDGRELVRSEREAGRYPNARSSAEAVMCPRADASVACWLQRRSIVSICPAVDTAADLPSDKGAAVSAWAVCAVEHRPRQARDG
jgi:hypothetical protein